ncbi:hypothetical protein V9T40_001519 [Parthenolecanium corni]|uniref:Neuroguidin n=1 Tax=Parthenolecanium corni TaxID=536013 RepID=A0AAN9TKD3_9HEMI
MEDAKSICDAYNDIAATCCKFGGILEKINHISPIESKGLSLLDIKCDTMISYLLNVSYLILKKCNGHSINDDETRERLVNARVILEKIKPLEDKLKYQIDKYVKASMTGQVDVADKSRYRANLKDLDSDVSDGEESNEGPDEETKESKETKKTGIYKIPKLAAVPYDHVSKEEKQKQLLEAAKKRALNSTVMQELKESYSEQPLEITNTNTLRNTLTNFRKEKERYEETYFTRLPVTKKEKHRDKLMSTLTMGNFGSEATRFEDLSALSGRLPSSTKKRKKSGKITKKKSFKRRRTF